MCQYLKKSESSHTSPVISRAKDADLPQNVVRSNSKATWDGMIPDILGQAFPFWQNAPVGRMGRLQPLEVIDLVPGVLSGLLTLGRLGGR